MENSSEISRLLQVFLSQSLFYASTTHSPVYRYCQGNIWLFFSSIFFSLSFFFSLLLEFFLYKSTPNVKYYNTVKSRIALSILGRNKCESANSNFSNDRETVEDFPGTSCNRCCFFFIQKIAFDFKFSSWHLWFSWILEFRFYFGELVSRWGMGREGYLELG